MTTPTTQTAPIIEMPLSPKPSLIAKLALVMAGVGYLPKSGHNVNFNYDFVRESDVLDAIRTGLSAHRVMVIPFLEDTSTREMATRNGTMTITLADYRFTFYDGDSDQTIIVRTRGEGMDGQDKGSNKALTAALKYALLKTFLIPTGDDPDAGHDERPAAPAPAPKRTAPPPASAAAAVAAVVATRLAPPVAPTAPRPASQTALDGQESPLGLSQAQRLEIGQAIAAVAEGLKDNCRADLVVELGRQNFGGWQNFLANGAKAYPSVLAFIRTYQAPTPVA